MNLEVLDAAWRNAHLASGVFSNALGDPGEAHADEHWRWGLAVVDGAGNPAAVTGAYLDGEGCLEIGVDVQREYRGRGLAPLVVSLISRRIADQGLVATYYCAGTNVRSHRTALASGFVPVVSAISIMRHPPPPPAK